ncbi:hypothetical protein ACFYUV_48770 [Nonomuraea sp. NPDC003560]|uniref:hypothetical protein n=1 Tax=Nonomuraea sp. NPDC003560 TaxID=3364341 RepID=UPI0036993C95
MAVRREPKATWQYRSPSRARSRMERRLPRARSSSVAGTGTYGRSRSTSCRTRADGVSARTSRPCRNPLSDS